MSEHHHRSSEPASDEKNLSVQPSQIEEKTAIVEEIGGPEGLEPTRYGDWERKGRCIDF